MDFIVKLFARCVALTVVAMPACVVAQMQSVLPQENLLPNVHVTYEASAVNGFKKQVDDAQRTAVKKYVKKTEARPFLGFLKGVVTYWLAGFAYGFLVVGALFLIASIVALNLPAFIVGGLFLLCGVGAVNATYSVGKSAYHDFAGRDEYIVVNDNIHEGEVLYIEVEEDVRRA